MEQGPTCLAMEILSQANIDMESLRGMDSIDGIMEACFSEISGMG
jgi:hypothetical protein